LEYLYALAIWQLLHLDSETGKIVTGGTDMQPRIKLALGLAKHLNAPRSVIKALEGARDAIRVEKLDERRNKAVHGVRFQGEESDSEAILIEVHRGAGGRMRHEQTNTELVAIGKELKAIHDQLLRQLKDAGVLATPTSKPARLIDRKTSVRTSGNESQPAS